MVGGYTMNLRKIIGFFCLIITSMFLYIDVFALEGEHFRRLSDNGEILVKTIKPNNFIIIDLH